jgi:hypothetical protein
MLGKGIFRYRILASVLTTILIPSIILSGCDIPMSAHQHDRPIDTKEIAVAAFKKIITRSGFDDVGSSSKDIAAEAGDDLFAQLPTEDQSAAREVIADPDAAFTDVESEEKGTEKSSCWKVL